MREGIGSIFLYNIIIIFIIITFAFIAGTLSYSKAFKVNSRIINSIEKYEGYNGLSISEIDNILGTIGYRHQNVGKCPTKNGGSLIPHSGGYKYCVYEFKEKNGYYSYGVLTYMYIDIPIIGDLLEVPVYSRTAALYQF